jgi:hypothetical protein
LKILFAILETESFKQVDYQSIVYLDDTDENEIVVISDKYKAHKIIRKADFRDNFRYSPGAFIHFLHENGSINKRTCNSKNLPVGCYLAETKQIIIPKVGEYYLDALTGFWKKASTADIEGLEREHKEALYIQFEQI